jgi:hypothetical protein
MGLLTAPMRARFGINYLLDYYNTPTPIKVIKRSCQIMNIPVTEDGANEIARRSRGTPESPTPCCAAFGISPRSKVTASSIKRSSTKADWTRWTTRSWIPLSTNSKAAPSG